MKLSQKGQALLEATFTLPLILILIGGSLFCFYSITTHYLVDHWSYQANLCLARQERLTKCKRQLSKKLRMIPFTQIKVITFFRGPKSTLIELTSARPSLLNIQLEDNLRLPIISRDFKR